jgi:DNA replication and repair protein RecF
MAEAGAEEDEIAAAIREGLAKARARDGAAGRSLFGPHRTDLTALHREKNRPAAEGSSGEQKALVLNLILAQISRLAHHDAAGAARPVLLLDEAPAHLDEARRAALFDEIVALDLQAFMTGTERSLFAGLDGRAQFVRVAGGALESD